MKRVVKERKPLILRVKSENGVPKLEVCREGIIPLQPELVQEVRLEEGEAGSPEVLTYTEGVEPFSMEPPADAIHVNREGHVTGPFTEKELRRHWANGVLHSDDFVWKEGMTEWVPLGSYFGVPAISTHGPSVATYSRRPAMEANIGHHSDSFPSKLVLPVILAILTMLSAVFFGIMIPENSMYFMAATGLTVLLALIVCLMDRRFPLVLLMTVLVLMPVLTWYLMIRQDDGGVPGNTVEKKEEPLPAEVVKPAFTKKA